MTKDKSKTCFENAHFCEWMKPVLERHATRILPSRKKTPQIKKLKNQQTNKQTKTRKKT